MLPELYNLRDTIVSDPVQETIKPLSTLFSQLLRNENDKKISTFIYSNWMWLPERSGCLSRFTKDEILDNRLQCFELDMMVELENRLNDIIVEQLRALLNRDKKKMCLNISEAKE